MENFRNDHKLSTTVDILIAVLENVNGAMNKNYNKRMAAVQR